MGVIANLDTTVPLLPKSTVTTQIMTAEIVNQSFVERMKKLSTISVSPVLLGKQTPPTMMRVKTHTRRVMRTVVNLTFREKTLLVALRPPGTTETLVK